MAARRFLQPVQWVEAHRSPLLDRRPQVYPLREGPPHDRPPVPSRGVQGGEGPPVPIPGGQVRELRGGPLGTGGCLCCQEGGPPSRWGMEVTTPPRREREAAAPKAPVVETPAAQEGAEEGGTEAGAQEEGGSAQEGEVVEMGE